MGDGSMTTTLQTKQQILVLTPIYPGDDIPKGWTPVVHYFAREWVKQGHEVHVVNYVANFPQPFYWMASLFRKKLTSKVGYTVRTTTLSDSVYELEGVNVCRIMMRKLKPHSRYSAKQTARALQKTKDYLAERGFTPDAIITHWDNPTLEMMYWLKQQYPDATACYVAHDASQFAIYGNDASRYWQTVDVVGFRSDYIKRRFQSTQEYVKPSFYCYSGIPAAYYNDVKERSWQGVNRVAYVGTLIARKYPAAIVPALHESLGSDFLLRYAGEGSEDRQIQKAAFACCVQKQVKLLGRIDRAEVIRLLDDSDLFIMISRGETFGLVYLEAMARGCITIASRCEGFDGIIRHGYNGFLCEAGNSKELATIVSHIKAMTPAQRRELSENAMATARELTDGQVAQHYLEHVLNR